MGMRKRLHDLKNWCPQPPNRFPVKLKSYSTPIAIGLVASLVLGVSLAIYMQYAVSQSVPRAPVVQPQIENSTEPSPITTATPSPNPTASPTIITKDQALNIAIPVIEKYAQDNNRTITNIDATLGQTSTTGDVASHLADPNQPLNTNSAWLVTAQFAPIPADVSGSNGNLSIPQNPQYWISGYQVVIWANTGQIYISSPQGVM